MRLRLPKALAFCWGLAAGSRQYAVARRLIRLPPALPPILVAADGGRAVLELDLRDQIQAEAFLVRRYAGDIVDVLGKHLAPGHVFFDVGANVGLVTFSVGALVPDVSIHAFEPHPLNHRDDPRAEAGRGRT